MATLRRLGPRSAMALALALALALVPGVLAGSVLGQGAPVAWATFHESATSTATLTADVLAPPACLVAGAPSCVTGSHVVDLATATSSGVA